MKKVEDVKRPLQIGELYSVLCIVRYHGDMMYITPVINHPHNDKENGQNEVHYHTDFRFVKNENGIPVNKHSTHYFAPDLRPEPGKHGKLERFILPVVSEDFEKITPVELIGKSKLKHKCIHNGKCPHRGYDLSQVKAKNGVIKCPLHGLEFDQDTKNLIT